MFDDATFNVFLIVLLIVGIWVFILWSNTRNMHKQIQHVAQQQSLIRHDDAARSLCRAIHYLQPSVHAGTDYVISEAGPGQKPFIANWLSSSIPQPTVEELEQAMQNISGIDPVKDHATQRLREYPSIGDQLDAAYKARHGDNTEQLRLDEQISKVKVKYPKSDECL